MTPLQLHIAKWQNCTRCILRDQRVKVVIGKGDMPCDVLMLGEAPGKSEDLIGTPFEGPAGILLDTIVREAMPLRYDDGPDAPPTGPKFRVAFTNIVACFPREAKKTADHSPPLEAIKACSPRVKEFAILGDPRLVVCVGDIAKKYHHLGIDAASERIKIIHIVHPARILGHMPHAQKNLAVQHCIVALATALEGLDEFSDSGGENPDQNRLY